MNKQKCAIYTVCIWINVHSMFLPSGWLLNLNFAINPSNESRSLYTSWRWFNFGPALLTWPLVIPNANTRWMKLIYSFNYLPPFGTYSQLRLHLCDTAGRGTSLHLGSVFIKNIPARWDSSAITPVQAVHYCRQSYRRCPWYHRCVRAATTRRVMATKTAWYITNRLSHDELLCCLGLFVGA